AALSGGNVPEAPQPENTAAARENVCSKIGLIGVALTVPPAHELPYPLHRRAEQAISPVRCWYRRDTAIVSGRSRTSSRDPLASAPSFSPSLRPPHHHQQQSSRNSSDGRSCSTSCLG
ncbi:unnamed protein product, partial [Ectocarpus sp. 12 AP-2014]